MTLEELKDILVEMEYPESVVFEDPDYLPAIIGVDDSTGAVIYDFDLMVQHLMDADGMEELDAVEFIEYNTIRALPYIREGVPPIIMRRIEF